MTLISRRLFLGATAATTSLGLASRRSLLAQSPNEKMGVAVVGTGGRGQSHIGAFLEDPRTEILAIVDVDEEHAVRSANAIEQRQGKRPAIYSDMRRVFDDKSVHAVSTATPNHWHALCGLWAMEAGKDVYIEKPISHNVVEGAALVKSAAKYERICQVGTQCRSSQAVQEAVKFIQDGGIGTVNFARGLCYKRRKSIGALGDYPIPSNVDFDLWSGPAVFTEPRCTRKSFHYDWHWQRLYGNGDLGNQGPHQTDIARWGLGLNRHPNQILSYGGRLGYQAERKDPAYVDAGDTANTEVSIYDYGDKCIVFETRGLDVDNSQDEELNRLFGSTSGNKVGVVFYGSEGYVVQREYTYCVAFDKEMNVIKEFKGGGDHFGNFIEACQTRDGASLFADALTGHLSAAVSHLGNISYYLGEKNLVPVTEIEAAVAKIKSLDDNNATIARTVRHLQDNGVELDKYPMALGPLLQFDPEGEQFINAPEANPLLGREYRAGYELPALS